MSDPPEAGARGEPDARLLLANERTLLAYQRTALGLLVAGLVVAGSRSVSDTPVAFAAIGLPLMVLGAAFSLIGRRRFLRTEDAMRAGAPLPPATAARTLPWGLALIAAIAVIVAVLQIL